MVTTDRRQEKARELVEAGNVFPIPGLRDAAVVLSSDLSMPYVACYAAGQKSCTGLDWEMWQERAGLLCKHIIAAKLDAGLDAQEEQAVARLKGRRSLALLNGDDEQYDTLTTKLGAA